MIKIFIVTYNNPKLLNKNLETLFNSHADQSQYRVEIINNFSLDFRLDEQFVNKVKVHHQTLRPDWSSGHLSRDWNQAIVNGFVDLNNPWCDQLILAQDDLIWDSDWKERLDKIHKTYTMYSGDDGDCIISLLPDAIKKIGLFDERFCAIGHHEGDFFFRAWLYNEEKSSINDYRHRRTLNTTDIVAHRNRIVGDKRSRVVDFNSAIALPFWESKWGTDITPTTWSKWKTKDKNQIFQKIPNYFTYPYFEKDIENTREKNYLHTGEKIKYL